MHPGSLPLNFNGSVPEHCSTYTGVEFDRFHCILLTAFRIAFYSYHISKTMSGALSRFAYGYL